MQKTLTALVVAAGVAGFAGSALAAGCGGYSQTVEISKPVVTADAKQSTPVNKITPETAKN